jgi:hypothetical protein
VDAAAAVRESAEPVSQGDPAIDPLILDAR